MFFWTWWVLDTLATSIELKVPTAFSWGFGDYVADLIVLGLIILAVIIFVRITGVAKLTGWGE